MDRYQVLREADPSVYKAIELEVLRQRQNLELIASENYTSVAVMTAMGSHLTNKYAEGYPGRRYYGGCVNVDTIEDLARNRAKQLFGAEHANVQPHCGAQANMAVYFSVLKPGDTVLGMDLAHGGHLTHGNPLNISGNLYKFIGYHVARETERIDYGRSAPAGPGAQAEADRGGRLGLPAHLRLPGLPRHRRRSGRHGHGGHGPHRRPGGRRPPPQPGAVRRLRHHHHPQDPARAARRHDPLPGEVRQGPRPRQSSPASRAARSCT